LTTLYRFKNRINNSTYRELFLNFFVIVIIIIIIIFFFLFFVNEASVGLEKRSCPICVAKYGAKHLLLEWTETSK